MLTIDHEGRVVEVEGDLGRSRRDRHECGGEEDKAERRWFRRLMVSRAPYVEALEAMPSIAPRFRTVVSVRYVRLSTTRRPIATTLRRSRDTATRQPLRVSIAEA